jgi:sensor domain CHASE-containing protein
MDKTVTSKTEIYISSALPVIIIIVVVVVVVVINIHSVL